MTPEAFDWIKAFARKDVDASELAAALREHTIDDVCDALNAFADIWGPKVPAAAIEYADLPIDVDEAASMFVPIDDDHDRLMEFAPDDE